MNSNLQNKLQQFNATPPAGAWDKIADTLDAGDNFTGRLLHYEEQPPLTAWQAVEQSLNEAAPVKTIPFTTRFRKPLRYAAVACLLAVTLVTITLTIKRTEAGALGAGSRTIVPTPASSGGTVKKMAAAPGSKAIPGVAPTETTIATGQKKDSGSPAKGLAETAASLAGAPANTPRYASLKDYVFFQDGDGQVRKISRKMSGFINCEDNDSNCKRRLQRLRQKMAANAMTTDFTGILDMLRQLQ